MYDPAIGRWNVMDPASQFSNPYIAMGNDPARFIDPDGQWIFSAFLPGVGPFIDAVLWGATIGVGTNGVGNFANDQPFFNNAGRAALWGGIGGAASFGIGSVFGATGSFSNEAIRAGAHALSGGIQSDLQGGSFWAGALSGALSSGISSGISALGGAADAQIIGGGIAGGIGAYIGGGDFFQGFGIGLTSGLLNHGVHAIKEAQRIRFFSRLRNHYEEGGGETFYLTKREVDYLVSKGEIDFRNLKLVGGNIWEYSIDFYDAGFDLRFSFGKASGAFEISNNGKTITNVRFYDRYDFDPKSWGTRTIPNELITRGYNIYSKGIAFDIIYRAK